MALVLLRDFRQRRWNFRGVEFLQGVFHLPEVLVEAVNVFLLRLNFLFRRRRRRPLQKFLQVLRLPVAM